MYVNPSIVKHDFANLSYISTIIKNVIIEEMWFVVIVLKRIQVVRIEKELLFHSSVKYSTTQTQCDVCIPHQMQYPSETEQFK